MPFPNMTPVEKIEHALRTERDALRAAGDTTAANAINTYLQQADETSKLRLIDILTRERPARSFSQEDIDHEMRALGCTEEQAIRSLTAAEEALED